MMKPELTSALRYNHQSFIDYMLQLPEVDFLRQYQEKWTAGQQLKHICLSMKPLVQALLFPKFMLRLLFGNANRTSKTYEELIAKYALKLEKGGKAKGRFIPKPVALEQRVKLTQMLSALIIRLNLRIERFSETELDRLVLPHPLLGKVTLREMLYFTIYHVQHHQMLTERNLKA